MGKDDWKKLARGAKWVASAATVVAVIAGIMGGA